MSGRTRYQFATKLRQLCMVLGISVDRVMRRAGIPPDHLLLGNSGFDARQFFAVWTAIVDEVERPDLPLFLGKTFARGPFVAPVFAFSCSPNIEVGLARLALFKPLLGPIRLDLEKATDILSITFRSADPDVRIPDGMAAFEIVYFLELARNFTLHDVVPAAVELPGEHACINELEAHFGIPAVRSDTCRLLLALEDAQRPLISENEELWAEFEPGLRRQLIEIDQQAPVSARVKSVLLELLPSGLSSAESVSERLSMSKRSLQRHLQGEGESFQSILDATRSELSLHYLKREEFSVEEISYLLAYRDPNSFYRAFHGWTGMTPMQARAVGTH
jgi:AraC-like DNA-binding protein